MVTVERSVLRIDRPEVQQGMTPQHRVRPLMPAAMRGDFAATDPFLALVVRALTKRCDAVEKALASGLA